MDPILDDTTNAIEITPQHYSQLNPGDIISYINPEIDGTIIHRIINTSFDSQGWYAITKGDNLQKPDPFKVRFNQIKRVVVAIIY